MSVVDHNAIELGPRISEAEVGDYIALLKPRVMSLVIFTALVGLVIAPGHVHPVLAFTSILCIAVGVGSVVADPIAAVFVIEPPFTGAVTVIVTTGAAPTARGGLCLRMRWRMRMRKRRTC